MTDADTPEPRPVPVAPYEGAPSDTGLVAGEEDEVGPGPDAQDAGEEGVVGATEVGGI